MRYLLTLLLLVAASARAQINDPAPVAPPSDYKRLAEDYAALHSRYTNLAASARLVLGEMKKEETALVKQVNELQKQLADLKQQTDESKNQSSNFKQQAEEAHKLANQLQLGLTNALARITELENKPAPDFLKQTDDLKALNAQLKQSADELRQQADDARKLADKTQTELTNALARLTILEARPVADLAQTEALKKENAELKQQADELILLAADSRKLADKTASDLTNALVRVAELETKPNTPDPALTQLADELKKQNEELKTQTDALKKDAAEFKQKADAAKKTADQNQTDLTVALARIGTLEAKPAPFTAEEFALLGSREKNQTVPQPTPAAPTDPDELANLLTAAQRAFAKGDFEIARDRSREILVLQPTNQLVLGNLGAIELELGDTNAEPHLKRALELKPDDAYCHSALGNLYFRATRYDDALTSLSRAVQLNPEDAQAQNFLGMTLCQKGQRPAAEAAFRKAIQIEPNYAGAHHNLAVFYASKETPEPGLAKFHYEKALATGGQRSPELEKLLEDATKK